MKKGEIIVREGDRITDEHLQKLSRVEVRESAAAFSVKNLILIFLLLFFSLALIYEYADKNIKKFTLAEKDLNFAAIFTPIHGVLLVKAATLIFEHFAPSSALYLLYIIPIFCYGIILRIVLFLKRLSYFLYSFYRHGFSF